MTTLDQDLKCKQLNKDNGRPYTDCTNKPKYRCVPLVEGDEQATAIASLWDGICLDHYLDYWDAAIGLVGGVKMEKIKKDKTHDHP